VTSDEHTLDAPRDAPRQDAAVVREAAQTCLAAHASLFAVALTVIVVGRVGAVPEDWVVIVRALLDPEPEERMEDAYALVALCVARARADAPGHREIKRLRAEVAERRAGSAARHQGELLAADAIVERLLDAIDAAPAVRVDALLTLPLLTQDAVVTEIRDAALPQTAVLVAAILRTGVTPALHEFLLDSIEAWAAHPDIRDAVEEIAQGARRALLEPTISKALRVVERARGSLLKLRPSEGRPALRAAPKAVEPATSVQGTVFSGTAYRRANIASLTAVFTLATLALSLLFVLLVVLLNDLMVPLVISGGAAVVLGLSAIVRYRGGRVSYRIVVAGDGARFEIDEGPRTRSLPFPLDYQAALQRVEVQMGNRGGEVIILRVAIRDDSGRTVVALEEPGTPPRGWSEAALDVPPAVTYGDVFGRIHLDLLERELARWNRTKG
jgi:hypothetical protein